MKNSESVTGNVTLKQASEVRVYSAYKISNPGFDVVVYSYKSKKQRKNRQSVYSQFIPAQTADKCLETNSHYVSPVRFSLQQNSSDPLSKRVIIKFYLPVDSKIELILMNSDKEDELYLINQDLKAGYYSFNTDINNDELLKYQYYYKLNACGFSEVREMKYTSQC